MGVQAIKSSTDSSARPILCETTAPMTLDTEEYIALVKLATRKGWAIGPSDISQELSRKSGLSVVACSPAGKVLGRVAITELEREMHEEAVHKEVGEKIVHLPPPPLPPKEGLVKAMPQKNSISAIVKLLAGIFTGMSAGWLVLSGTADISAQSQGADSWADETSFAALTIRSIGGLKVGIGIGMFAPSLLLLGTATQTKEQ